MNGKFKDIFFSAVYFSLTRINFANFGTDKEFRMILTSVFVITLSTIPNELTLREHSSIFFVGAGLFISFLLMSFAKLSKSDIYYTLIVSFSKLKGLNNFIKESHPLYERGGLLLIVNYLVSFSLILFILVNLPGFEISNENIIYGLTPVALLIWSLGSFHIVGAVSGESQLMVEPVQLKIIGAQLLGIIYFILTLVWMLSSIDETLFIVIATWTFIVESVIRILKSIIIVYRKGVSWYYIILYFCTLEIMPLIVIYYFLTKSLS